MSSGELMDGKALTAKAHERVSDKQLTATLNDKAFQEFARILILLTFGTANTNDENWFSYTFACNVPNNIKFVNVHVRTMLPDVTHQGPSEVM